MNATIIVEGGYTTLILAISLSDDRTNKSNINKGIAIVIFNITSTNLAQFFKLSKFRNKKRAIKPKIIFSKSISIIFNNIAMKSVATRNMPK